MFNRRSLLAGLVIIFLVLIVAGNISAQDGRWVEFDMSAIGANLGMGGCEDGIIFHVPSGSRYFLVFDINVGEWLTIDLGTIQTFQEGYTRGHLACAYSEELLIGYSDIGAVWDTIYYSGAILSGDYGFVVGENLALFITDDFLYIFDAETGEWDYYAYTMPADYAGYAHSWIKSDYAAVVLERDNAPAHPANVVYSQHTKSFNEIEQGIYYPSPLFDHGFARFMQDETESNFRLVGYSAIDNQFDVTIYTPITGEEQVGSFVMVGEPYDQYTTFMDGFRYGTYQYGRVVHYAYDTRNGEWVDQTTTFYSPDQYGNFVYFGGQFGFDFGIFDEDASAYFIFFDGTANAYRNINKKVNTDLSWYIHMGGDCFLYYDSTMGWAYNITADLGKEMDWENGFNHLIYSGQDYHTITICAMVSDIMRTYFYNSRTNSWQWITVPNHSNWPGVYNNHNYIHNGPPDNSVVFYSALHDEIIHYDLPDDNFPYVSLKGHLAMAATETQSALFDGWNGNSVLYSFDAAENSVLGLGTNSAIFCDNDENTLFGYSVISGKITAQAFPETPYYCLDTGYIGIQSVYYNNGTGFGPFNKVYTYNGFADSWITLIPEGNSATVKVGTKTALIGRTTGGGAGAKLYAFDPQRQVTAVEDDEFTGDGILPEKFTLSQNFPNPFNPSTVVEYSLPHREKITIEIFDILGRKVRTLLNQETAAGKYRAVWNGKDDRGGEVATGVYFCRLTAGAESLSKKMVLLK